MLIVSVADFEGKSQWQRCMRIFWRGRGRGGVPQKLNGYGTYRAVTASNSLWNAIHNGQNGGSFD